MQDQKDEIELKAEAKRKELEAKKRKEQRKQAILNKALALVDVGVATALGIMQSYAQLGPIAGSVGAVLVAALGAIQTAAIIAKPIPKFVKGTQGTPHKGGPALVGEERPEVIEEPGKDPYIISHPAVLNLARGTEVTPSVEEYDRKMRRTAVKALKNQNGVLADFKASNGYGTNDDRLINEMRLTRKAIKDNKTSVSIKQEKADIPHALFSFKNTNWN